MLDGQELGGKTGRVQDIRATVHAFYLDGGAIVVGREGVLVDFAGECLRK